MKSEVIPLESYGELAVLFGLCLLCEGLTALLPFPLPGSVLSLLLLLVLLLTGVLKERHIGRVSAFFTGNMAFFFIPPVWASWSTGDPLQRPPPLPGHRHFHHPAGLRRHRLDSPAGAALQRRGGSRR